VLFICCQVNARLSAKPVSLPRIHVALGNLVTRRRHITVSAKIITCLHAFHSHHYHIKLWPRRPEKCETHTDDTLYYCFRNDQKPKPWPVSVTKHKLFIYSKRPRNSAKTSWSLISITTTVHWNKNNLIKRTA